MNTIENTMKATATRVIQRILGGHGINGSYFDGLSVGLQCSGFPELSDAINQWSDMSPSELADVINRWSGRVILNSDLTLA